MFELADSHFKISMIHTLKNLVQGWTACVNIWGISGEKKKTIF